MQPDEFSERLADLGAQDVASDLGSIDPQDALHVDRAAERLVKRFYETNDSAVFTLLVDLTLPHVTRAAEGVVREQGVLVDPGELVNELYVDIFIDLSPKTASQRHFLAEATRRLDRQALALCEALAALPFPRQGDSAAATAPDDPLPVGVPGTIEEAEAGGSGLADLGNYYINLFKVCFHRLDRRYRQVIRATDGDMMLPADIAQAFGSSEQEVLELLEEGRLLLKREMQKAQDP